MPSGRVVSLDRSSPNGSTVNNGRTFLRDRCFSALIVINRLYFIIIHYFRNLITLVFVSSATRTKLRRKDPSHPQHHRHCLYFHPLLLHTSIGGHFYMQILIVMYIHRQMVNWNTPRRTKNWIFTFVKIAPPNDVKVVFIFYVTILCIVSPRITIIFYIHW